LKTVAIYWKNEVLLSLPPKPGQSPKVDNLSLAEVEYLRKEERNE